MADLEYHVSSACQADAIYTDVDKAFAAAMMRACSCGEAIVDVVTWTKAAARQYGGDDAVECYNEDPDASVFERIEIKVNVVGRVA